MKLKQALYLKVDDIEIFFPKVRFTENCLEVFYNNDVVFQGERITSINMVNPGKGDIRTVVIPETLDNFEKWYTLLISSKLFHITVPYYAMHTIYWDHFPCGYGDSIEFDIYREILKFEKNLKENKFPDKQQKFKFVAR